MTHKQDWEKAQGQGYYIPAAYEQDGFIHSSIATQVLATANRRYKADRELVLLAIDESKVQARIVYEDLNNTGEKHPHIYGKLSIEAVAKVYDLLPNEAGEFTELPFKGGE